MYVFCSVGDVGDIAKYRVPAHTLFSQSGIKSGTFYMVTRSAGRREDLDCSQYQSFLSAYIYVRTLKPKKDGTVNASWYLRINLPERKQLEESLKSIDTHPSQAPKAVKAGEARLSALADRYDSGLDKKQKTLIEYGEDYLLEGYSGWIKNDKLIKSGYTPIHRNKLGSALWSDYYYSAQEGYFRYLVKPFFEQSKYNKPITKVTQKDIFAWDEFRKTSTGRDKPYAPGSIQKHNTLIRMIFKWAQLEGERFVPPILPEEPKNIAGRRRPEMPDDIFDSMQSYLRKQNGMSGESDPRNESEVRARNTDYLLYCWLETLDHFGIRGGLSTNPIKMTDIERVLVDDKPQFFLQRNEKSHSYVAVGYRYWEKTLNRLNAFYESHGMFDRTYLFEHYEDRGENYSKGDPIRAFRKSWNRMCRVLKVNEGETETTKIITPYSIRHRALGRAIMQPNVNPLEVAKAYGTSYQQIEISYLHYSVKKNYDRLVNTDISRYEVCDIMHPHTGMVIKQVTADSPEHFKLWKENKSLVEFEPSRNPERWT